LTSKNESRYEINALDQLFEYNDLLLKSVEFYEKETAKSEA